MKIKSSLLLMMLILFCNLNLNAEVFKTTTDKEVTINEINTNIYQFDNTNLSEDEINEVNDYINTNLIIESKGANCIQDSGTTQFDNCYLSGTQFSISSGSYTQTGQMYYTRYHSSHEPVFCLQFKLKAGNITSESGSGNIYNSLTSSDQRHIKQYVSWGLRYYNQYDNPKYLVATQYLIWETTDNIKINWSGTTDIRSYMSKIKNSADTNEVAPSFAKNSASTSTTPTTTLKYNASTKQYEAVVTDKNGVYDERYHIKNGTKIGDYTFTDPSGANNLKITTTNDYAKPLVVNQNNMKSFYFNPNNSGYKAKIITTTGQDFVGAGLSDPTSIEMKLAVEPALGNVTINKTNQLGEPVEGVTFDLYDSSGKKLKSGTTDKNGNVTFSNLRIGEYYVKETNTENEDVLLTNEKYTFNIIPNKTVSKKIMNQQILGDVHIWKKNQNDLPLSNVTFELWGKSKTSGEYYKKDQCVTDEKGYCEFTHLGGGDYYIIETHADDPDIYLDDTKYYFTIDKPSQIIELNGGKVTNQQYGEVRIDYSYTQMSREQVDVAISTEGYIDPNNSEIKMSVEVDGVIYDTKTLNLLEDNTNLVFTAPITINELVAGELINFTFENTTGMYRFESYPSTNRMYPANKTIDIYDSNKIILNNQYMSHLDDYGNTITDEQYRTGKDEYNVINYEGTRAIESIQIPFLHKDTDITNGQIAIDERMYCKLEYGGVVKYPVEHIPTATLFMPLYDETMSGYNYDDGYEIPLNVLYDGKSTYTFEIKNMVMEKGSGRIYDINSEYYKNATTDHKQIEKGYRDQNEDVIPVQNVYLLPIYNTFDYQKQTYDYQIKIEGVGYNNTTVIIHESFYFDTKLWSMKKDYGLNTIKIKKVDDTTVDDINNDNYTVNKKIKIPKENYTELRNKAVETNTLYQSDIDYLKNNGVTF